MAYTLQIIHQSDLEAGLLATGRMAQSAAIVDKFQHDYANTLTDISGDAWIQGAFYAAEGDPTVTAALRAFYGNSTQAAGPARVSVAYMNAIKTNVASFGNHEFDSGTAQIADAIKPSSSNAGAKFPYLSADYDFSRDPNLASLVTADGQNAASIPGKIAASTVVTINGERIGIVGATTQVLASISSPGLVTGKTPNVDDMDALARVLQPYLDALTAQGINKIVLSTHLQQYQLETALAAKLSGVDVIVSGGSHALFADGTDVVRPGDTVAQNYPLVLTDKDGNPVLQVNTENEYAYVGRAVVQFDDAGHVIPGSVDPVVSGNYATTDAVVAQLYGAADPYAAGSEGAAVKALVAPVGTVINAKDGNVAGFTNVYLDGNRLDVRNQETNLGDLSADANLALARRVDPTVTISIKNGGGIRDVIGTSGTGPQGGNLPPAANPSAGKPMGAVSQLDIENSLRFNNNLSLLTVSALNIYNLVEHGVAAYAPGTTPGQFPQISGIQFSFDPSRQAQVLDASGRVTTAGQRVRNLAILNDDGSVRDVIVKDGALVGDPARAFRVVTLDFMASGGDGYRFDVYGSGRVDLLNNAAIPDSANTFATKGSEQDALAKLLKSQYATAATAYTTAETDLAGDVRTQNLAARADAVLAGASGLQALDTRGVGGAGANILLATLAGQQPAGGAVFVTTSPDGASFGAPLPGQVNVAEVTAAAAPVSLPGGFAAALLRGSFAGTLVSASDNVLLAGNAAASTLAAFGAASTVVGGSGNTVLFASRPSAVMVGGDGDDTFFGSGTMYTGGGRNLVALADAGSTVLAQGADTIIAGAGADTVGATGGSLGVFGGAGRLFVAAGVGAASVYGGAGSATVVAGAGGGVYAGGRAGNNVLVGGSGSATLFGASAGDQLFAGTGDGNVLVAGSGNETLAAAAAGAGGNTFILGAGADFVAGGAGSDTIVAGSGSATVATGGSDDLIFIGAGRAGRTIEITDFDVARDKVALVGMSADAAVATATHGGFGTTLTLSDGSRLTFDNLTAVPRFLFA